jgi:hypothetical protein
MEPLGYGLKDGSLKLEQPCEDVEESRAALWDLVRMCRAVNPEERLSAADLVRMIEEGMVADAGRA